MNVFEFRDRLVNDYEQFTTSFVSPGSKDIKDFVDTQYKNETYWPSPYLQLNPSFVLGKSVKEHVASGSLHPLTEKIFRIKRNTPYEKSLQLFSHQEHALKIAERKRSYVVTTGTGSGKSLTFFIPIIDAILKAKELDKVSKTRAIIIYPMNALANSQLEELNEFLGEAGKPVTYGRYTGQESDAERLQMAQTPPDILLTNFMMLELLMTRQDSDKDKKIVEHCRGLEFLVLDELHTYRGRQGADVAMLVRRIRESLNPNVLTIGTSATMATEGKRIDRAQTVAAVATTLFGTRVQTDDIIGETLELKTIGVTGWTKQSLEMTVSNGVPSTIAYEELRNHPVACWIETRIGLTKEDDLWIRNRPLQLKTIAKILGDDTGIDPDSCIAYLLKFLLLTYNTRNHEGRSFFAYRLHQFISGAGTLYATLEAPEKRTCDLSGQVYLPGSERSKRLFDTHFCRSCGQEYHPVWELDSPMRFEPRKIDELSLDEDNSNYAFLMPDCEMKWNESGIINDVVPETWINPDKPTEIKSPYKDSIPTVSYVAPDGLVAADGIRCVVIRGSFKFCPSCGIQYDRGKDALKLPGLSGEGRSSATTILSLNSLRYLLDPEVKLEDAARKLLGFTDNRQDASLQAGHFNDFMQMLLLRSALLTAIANTSEKYLREDTFADEVFKALQFHTDDPAIRCEYLQEPHVLSGINKKRAEDAMRRVLGHRLYLDLRRGWRYNSPNLEQLGLLKIEYEEIDDLCNDEYWQACDSRLKNASPEVRKKLLTIIFNDMRRKLCIQTHHLSDTTREQIRTQSASYLKEPWGIFEDADIATSRVMIVGSKKNSHKTDDMLEVLSIRSKAGTDLKKPSTWGIADLKLTTVEFEKLVLQIVTVAENQGYLTKVELGKNDYGYQLKGDLLIWKRCDGHSKSELSPDRYAVTNEFFAALYNNVAEYLVNGVTIFHSLHAREHTAQVESELREEREDQFRKGDLKILFCSPTMELGVNIATLNTVYMRNVPPTPANYAQRSGRAGRSGQPALVITYCAAQSPHDQYFFADPVRMIHGEVIPPSLDLCNDDLLASHIHATWLATTGVKLPSTINEMLDMQQPDSMPLQNFFQEQLSQEQFKTSTYSRARKIMSMIEPEYLERAKGLWLAEEKPLSEAIDQWLTALMHRSYKKFDDSLRRWRDIYKATRRQMDETRKIMDNPAATEKERNAAKRRHDEAFNQQKLLLEPRVNMNSDFSTYRYLAGEGFLPGYNFPRLPVSAYIPAQTNKKKYDSYLSRPRFLAISEFGPNSLIYHEGAQYRVRQVILTARGNDVSTESSLPVEQVTVCGECGYGHYGEQKADEFCALCKSKLGSASTIHNLYRIENVSTRKANRITCDEEERLRQGYDVRTTVQFVKKDGKLNRRVSTINFEGREIVELQYGPTATVRRINLGWKRRKEKSIFGFNINTASGFWSKDEHVESSDDSIKDDDSSIGLVQRICPYAEDRRNVLLMRVHTSLESNVLTTLQYALKRAIESLYQLEENELMAEPLPDRDNRQAILFYESAEGGAGVLTRLATQREAIGPVARKALELMHYTLPDGKQPSVEELLAQNKQNSLCEVACYKCLLSYYNQPEHETIDRTNPQVLMILLQMIRAEVGVGSTTGNRENQFAELMTLSGSTLEKVWLNFLYVNQYILPDRAQFTIPEVHCRPDFVYTDHQTLIFIDGQHHESDYQLLIDNTKQAQLEEYGYIVVRFPKEQDQWITILAMFPDIFGTSSTGNGAST